MPALTRTTSSSRVHVEPSLVLLVACAVACGPRQDARTAREETVPGGLAYRVEVDSTRLRRGSGLSAVASVGQLVEDGLSRFFRVQSGPAGNDAERQIVAESPAPGYGVRAIIEQRADDFCMVIIEAVRLRPDGPPVPTPLAPYSVHFAMEAVHAAVSALHPVNWPVMTTERFDLLRKQAAALAAAGEDPPIDEPAFAHTPRPLHRADDPPRYYAPRPEGSTLRGQ
jgi:hypothetical protein